MRNTSDTIAAVATAQGEGGIAIIRISGAEALSVLKRVFRPSKCAFEPSKMYYGHIKGADGSDIDEVMAVYFKAPRTYTREDVCEIHCHGGRVVTGQVLERVIACGARPAERGEFTYRAFANGRLDLSKAEAVMQLISASSERAVRGAVRQLKGGVSSRIGKCRERLMETVVLIDAAADFPEEIDEEVTLSRVKAEAEAVRQELVKSCDRRYARMVSDGARVVIAGKPNVGKSSLMNSVLCTDRAIVSDIAGTTRDTVSESVIMEGLKYTFTDTAGIRETDDAIEKLGVDRAKDALETADCVLILFDASKPLEAEDEALINSADSRTIIAANKCDSGDLGAPADIRISAKQGTGVEQLLSMIRERCAANEDDEKLMSLRHIAAAEKALECLERVDSAPFLDMTREDITGALMHLGEITGEDINETAIDGIFERFCVGK